MKFLITLYDKNDTSIKYDIGKFKLYLKNHEKEGYWIEEKDYALWLCSAPTGIGSEVLKAFELSKILRNKAYD